jgi:two-component system, OmpR family, sensor kinase
VRYTTRDDDTVLLYARPMRGAVALGVADSGRGFTTEMLRGAAGQDLQGGMLDGVGDDLSQTGLGLSLVRDVATRRGGWVQLGVSPWGGADVSMILPVRPAPPALPVARPTPAIAPEPTEQVSFWSSAARREPEAGTGARSA